MKNILCKLALVLAAAVAVAPQAAVALEVLELRSWGREGCSENDARRFAPRTGARLWLRIDAEDAATLALGPGFTAPFHTLTGRSFPEETPEWATRTGRNR